MKKNDILLILVPSFIFALAWIGFSVYHSFVSSTISESLNEQIIPIRPDFDTKTINAIKQRESITPVYQLEPSSIAQIASRSSTVTPTPEAIQPTPPISSAAAQQASSGGGLTQ